MSKKIIKRETALMTEAFCYYYTLGDDRNYRNVAQQFHKSERAVRFWADSFDWAGRVAEKDRLVAAELERKTLKDIIDSKANYRKIIKLAVKNLVDNLTETDEQGNPKMKITSISDLEKLVKLDLTLMGEYTEITKVKSENAGSVLTEADRKALQDLTRAIVDDIRSSVTLVEDEEMTLIPPHLFY